LKGLLSRSTQSSSQERERERERERECVCKVVRRARQPVGKYNINKRQSDFSGQKFQPKKFWKKIQALDSLEIF
jgi:hypothetical protein